MTQEEAKNYVATQVYDNNNKEVKAGNVRNSVNKAIDYTKEIEDKVATIGTKVDGLVTSGARNLYDLDLRQHGKALNSPETSTNVREASNTANYSLSPYIAVKPNTKYYIGKTNTPSATYNSYIFVDSNKNYIAGAQFGGTQDYAIITSTANSAYVRFSYYDPANSQQFQLVESEIEVTEYIPYAQENKVLASNIKLAETHIAQVEDAVDGQIDNKLGQLNELETTEKTNIVSAINELCGKEVDAYSKSQSDARYASAANLSLKADVEEGTEDATNLYNPTLRIQGSAFNLADQSAAIRTASNTTKYSLTPYIAIEGDTTYYIGKAHSAASYNAYIFFNANKQYVAGGYFSSLEKLITAPSGAVYLRVSYYNETNADNIFMVVKSSVVLDEYIPYTEQPRTKIFLSENVNLKSKHIEEVKQGLQDDFSTIANLNDLIKTNNTFFFPDKVFCLKNRLLTAQDNDSQKKEAAKSRLFEIGNIIVSRCKNLMYLDKESSSTTKSSNDNTIYFNGDETGILGNYSIYSRLTGSKLYQLNASATHYSVDSSIVTNPLQSKNLMWIGDSYSNSGAMIQEAYHIVKDVFGLTNVNFIGKRKDTDCTVPDATDSLGNHHTLRHQGKSGYTILDYSKSDNNEGRGTSCPNPFIINETWSISQYVTDCGAESLDYVVIELGVNDLMLNNASADVVATRMCSLIDKIKTAYPSIQIIIVGQVCIDEINSRAATSSNIGMCEFDYNSRILAMNKAYQNISKNSNYSSFVTYCDVGAMFRIQYGWEFVERNIIGSEETEKIIINKMHPSKAGYYMLAENISCCIAYTWFKI